MKYKLNGQWYEIAVPSYDSTPVGTIVAYSGSTLPNGYMLCNGQSLLRTEYPDLFNAIGTTYGSVDSTHFNLPNIKGRVLVGLDSTQTEFNALGKVGGSKELQAHHHDELSQLGMASGNGNTTGDINNISVAWQTNVKHFKVDQTIGTGNSGNLQPYIVVNYIIKAHPSAVNTSEVVNEHSTSETDVYSANQTNVEIENAVKDVYSTSEVKTNKVYVDSNNVEHPIYRKVIELTNVPRGYSIYRHNINNLGDIINVYGRFRDGNTQNPVTKVVADNITTYGIGVLDISATDFHTLLGSGVPTTNTMRIVFEYTKQ